VLRVIGGDGEVLREKLRSNELPARVATGRVAEVDAYLTTYLMRETVRAWYGTAHRASQLGGAIAGKTGSTNDNRDAWFIGYSPRVVAGVWVGNDDRTPMARDQTGAGAALPIWTAFMEHALARMPAGEFAVPAGIAWAGVDPETSLRVHSPVFYPGWVPVAAGRAPRFAKFVPSPWKEPEPEIAPEAALAATPASDGEERTPTTDPSPAGDLFDALLPAASGQAADGEALPPVGAAPPRDSAETH
jgi:membrane peptidoglycan carboxypeptidase